MKTKAKKYIAILTSFIVLLPLFLFPGCTPYAEPINKIGYFFNTFVSITFYNDADAKYFEDCENLCRKYENLLSRTVEGSDIYRINNAGGEPVTIDDETAELLQIALSFCEKTDGAVDITVAPLMDAWNFTGEETDKIPPSEAEIYQLLSHVNYKNITLDGNTVTLSDPEAAIDLGFIAKGYIADRLKEFLVEKGVKSAIINLGGNIQLIGSKPDGGDYLIGIKKPFSNAGKEETLTTLSLSDISSVSSGIYERCFTYDGTLYHHILDPKTGYPVNNDLYQVTILCKDSVYADALSTTLMLLGKEEGLRFLENEDFEAHAAFVNNKNELSFSPDFPE